MFVKLLFENGFKRGKVDNTLFLKSTGEHLLIVQVYIDDIIFGASHKNLCNEFSKMMKSEFEMSMMGLTNQANFKWHHDPSTEICKGVT